ncbi:MAG: hypothetical protein KTR33_02820 [Gammaproteobacteria bacterium]|nr:hypothetical protein [Gammaproteobacteria bacterium]
MHQTPAFTTRHEHVSTIDPDSLAAGLLTFRFVTEVAEQCELSDQNMIH